MYFKYSRFLVNISVNFSLTVDIQGNVRALKYALSHPLVYRDPNVDLDKVKRTVPEFRRVNNFFTQITVNHSAKHFGVNR